MKKDILKIINHYGVKHQLKYFQSEVFEFNEAIVEMKMKMREMEGKTPKIVEPTFKTYRLHIAEELADVMMMLKQFQYYYEISDEEVADVMKYKVQRQLRRIENEEVNNVRTMGEEKKGRR